MKNLGFKQLNKENWLKPDRISSSFIRLSQEEKKSNISAGEKYLEIILQAFYEKLLTDKLGEEKASKPEYREAIQEASVAAAVLSTTDLASRSWKSGTEAGGVGTVLGRTAFFPLPISRLPGHLHS